MPDSVVMLRGVVNDIGNVIAFERVDGSDQPIASAALADSGVYAPALAPSLALSGAGPLTGVFVYAVAFELLDGRVTEPGLVTSGITCAANAVQVSNIQQPDASLLTIVQRIRLYRTKTNGTQLFQLATLPLETTTFFDNTADAAITVQASAAGTASGIMRASNGQPVAHGLTPASTTLAVGAATKPIASSVVLGARAASLADSGHNTIAIGFQAAESATSNQLSVIVGSLANRAQNNISENVVIGALALRNSASGSANTAIGTYAIGAAANAGSLNTSIGYASMQFTENLQSCIGVGAYSARYANANGYVHIDSRARADTSAEQNEGWASGITDASVTNQRHRFNGLVRLGAGAAPVVAGLPAAAASLRGFRGYVTDATVAYASANLGATAVGGGANTVPVFCTGVAWVIG